MTNKLNEILNNDKSLNIILNSLKYTEDWYKYEYTRMIKEIDMYKIREQKKILKSAKLFEEDAKEVNKLYNSFKKILEEIKNDKQV
jgi:hypothetical protein|tara:strand:+ start:1038 stop:1295 length:258 start_codon:yes stop_codon:yes gene_type:complete